MPWNGKRLAARAAVFVLAATFIVPSALAQGPSLGAARKWSIEGFGGSSRIQPEDLNAYSLNTEAVYSSYYEALFSYNESAYRGLFTWSITRKGEFPSIRGAWTGGVRLSYQVAPRVAATFGLHYLARERSATVTRARTSTLYNRDAVSFETTDRLEYGFAPSTLAVAAYTPLAGLRVALFGWRRLRVEATAAGGAVRASSRIEEDRTSETTSYRQRSSVTTRMRGTGWGAAAEAGARAAWSAGSRWNAFVEASYQYQRIGNVSGTTKRTSTTQDGDAASAEREVSQEVSGQWRMLPWRVAAPFGSFDQPVPAIGSAQNPAFRLDLSGVRLTAGVGFRFSNFW
jgi:hypothetical protein